MTMHQESSTGHGHCHCRGGHVQGFVRPRLLLQLSKRPAHGYELLEVLESENLPTPDPSTLYRTLRQFEKDGLVRSTWDTSSSGPARRVYELTDEGVEYLHAWAVNIRRIRRRLSTFLDEYETRFQIGEEGGEPDV
ncbi:MAG: helix-turn-helix transcriptional regulator [Chloroflexota bacterium]